MSQEARIETGFLLRKLQQGENLEMPHSPPMQSIGKHCHELRIADGEKNWKIIYPVDEDGIIIIEVFNKTTRATPKKVIETCKERYQVSLIRASS
ncbi:MAG: type II toxin-antitoxin system RelE/ParE family toxin [Cyanobacteria bacterium P01_D01_bin.50]